MRPMPSRNDWGSWNELPDRVTISNPTKDQQELADRIDRVRALHPDYFDCPAPEFREWLLRRSWEAVATLQSQLIRMGQCRMCGGPADRDSNLCGSCRDQADPGNQTAEQLALA